LYFKFIVIVSITIFNELLTPSMTAQRFDH